MQISHHQISQQNLAEKVNFNNVIIFSSSSAIKIFLFSKSNFTNNNFPDFRRY